jgi:hypothetical protein
LNLVVGRLTVPIIESHCNQLKLGHPPQPTRFSDSLSAKRGESVAE